MNHELIINFFDVIDIDHVLGRSTAGTWLKASDFALSFAIFPQHATLLQTPNLTHI